VEPFERVVRQHGAVVWRVCRALLGPADADDAWEETFLAAMQAYPRLRAGSNVKGWLVTIAYRKSIDQLRAARRRTDAATRLENERPTGQPKDPGGDDTFDGGLAAALAALAPKQRAAVTGRYLADLSYAELAEMLGTSEAAARRSAADGIAKLRGALEQRRDRPRASPPTGDP
jgi:RNA polymerase sigma factor (sigma-70 family)